MNSQAPKYCDLDGIPLTAHARCWKCEALVGPDHADPGPLVRGLCSSCHEERKRRKWTPAPAERSDRWLTVADVARMLKVDPKTVRRMIRKQMILASSINHAADPRGARYRILMSEIERYMKAELIPVVTLSH